MQVNWQLQDLVLLTVVPNTLHLSEEKTSPAVIQNLFEPYAWKEAASTLQPWLSPLVCRHQA